MSDDNCCHEGEERDLVVTFPEHPELNNLLAKSSWLTASGTAESLELQIERLAVDASNAPSPTNGAYVVDCGSYVASSNKTCQNTPSGILCEPTISEACVDNIAILQGDHKGYTDQQDAELVSLIEVMKITAKAGNHSKQAGKKTKKEKRASKEEHKKEEGNMLKLSRKSPYKQTKSSPVASIRPWSALKTFSSLDSYRRHLLAKMAEVLHREVEPMTNFQISSLAESKGRACEVKISKNSEELKHPNFLLKPPFSPFSSNQSFLLSSKNGQGRWFLYVMSMDNSQERFELCLKLHNFNQASLPMDWQKAKIEMLPIDGQEVRMLAALERIERSQFLGIALGRIPPIVASDYCNENLNTSERLNDSQHRAVSSALNEKVTLIRGPPGTGKTAVIADLVKKLLERNEGWPILCVAESNIAVDNLYERLSGICSGPSLLRVTSNAKEPSYPPDESLGNACLHNIMFPLIPPHLQNVKKLLQERKYNAIAADDYQKLLDTQAKLKFKILSKAKVVLTTNIASGGLAYEGVYEFETVIMDECTQASELSSLVPISLPHVEKLVFLGDEKQLSCFSRNSSKQVSLFEKLLANKNCNPVMLNIQYRMHPLISEFPAKTFYHGSLKDGISSEDREWPMPLPVIAFHHLENAKESVVSIDTDRQSRHTYRNLGEAEIVLKIVQDLISTKGVRPDQIGVITTYSAQRNLIIEMAMDFFQPEQKRSSTLENMMNGSAGDGTEPQAITNNVNGMVIATVDSYQGQENDFIILSCVRSNNYGAIGFTADKKRLNVALTRARYGLLIIGNKKTLTIKGAFWRKLIEHLESRGALINGYKNLNE